MSARARATSGKIRVEHTQQVGYNRPDDAVPCSRQRDARSRWRLVGASGDHQLRLADLPTHTSGPMRVFAPRAGPLATSRATPRESRTSVWRRVIRLVLVAVAYYVGARIGFLFQTPSVPQSVLWLPNSILFAVLFVSPPRSWPALLLAALPAQLIVAWQSHAPLGTMALLYVTNCADAALSATLCWLAFPGEWRIQGLRSMLAFLLLGATLPPLLLSFADAAISVATGWTSAYWTAYTTRARANVLTNVVFVPAAVAVLGLRREALAGWWRRWLEVTVVVAGIIATTVFSFSRPIDSISVPAPVYAPLVFLVWCAVRFSVGTTSAALLTLAYVTTWMVMRGVRPDGTHSGTEVIPALQFELLAIAVPLLCLCAVVQDRARATTALTESQAALRRSLAEIRDLAGRLLKAGEAERARLARELHDDVCQQVAACGIALSALKRHLPDDPALHREVAALQQHEQQLANAIRALSHELHPAALRHAGLVPAMRQLCLQYDGQSTLRVELTLRGGMVGVPDDLALCVYRVTQEALRNAARHSGSPWARVVLADMGAALELVITDAGVGFDEREARARGGLGLTSLEERVRLVGGVMHLETAPGNGTRIAVRIPHGEENGSRNGVTRR